MKNGHYKPDNCTTVQKVAIVVPYRNRENQLRIFLNNVIPKIYRQQLEFGIYMIDQVMFKHNTIWGIEFSHYCHVCTYFCLACFYCCIYFCWWLYLYPAPRRVRGYTVLPLSVLPSVCSSIRPRYFSSHFSQRLLMAEILYLVTSSI